MISAVLIVKNEEAMLSRCLDSLTWIVDEIVIVDTWSIDTTVEIAKRYTNNIWYYTWNNDFASARNYALWLATQDWILSIDADEYVEYFDKDLFKYISTLEYDWMYVCLQSEWTTSKNYAVRLFKRWVKFTWKIHEYPECQNISWHDVLWIVYWSSPTHLVEKDLDLRILESEYISNKTPRIMFYYWRELWYHWMYQQAIDILYEYIWMSTFYEEVNEAYYIIAQCYWQLWQGHKAREICWLCIVRNPHMAKAISFMADMCWDREWKRRLEFLKNADNSWVLFKE